MKYNIAMLKLTVYVVIFTFLCDNVICWTNFCDKKICRRYRGDSFVYAHNIGCNNSDQYGASCPKVHNLQIFNSELQELILDLHNTNRNSIALGNIDGYEAAVRMTTMHWDYQLAYLAQLNVISCVFGHDDCRNTNKYRHAGQNIVIEWSTAGYFKKTNANAITSFFNTFFNEYVQCDMKVINSYYDTGLRIGHFTQIVSDKSSALGCAIMRWYENSRYYTYFVCNYSFTNFEGQPVYTAGETASQCQTGTNDRFEGLCSPTEYVAPVPNDAPASSLQSLSKSTASSSGNNQPRDNVDSEISYHYTHHGHRTYVAQVSESESSQPQDSSESSSSGP